MQSLNRASSKPAGIEFEKFHGLGNDFLFLNHTVLDCYPTKFEQAEFVKQICRRNFAVGADGVLFTNDEEKLLLILNADGSEAATCGNALRCYGLKLLRQNQWCGEKPLPIKRLGNPTEVFATLLFGSLETQQITVAMGQERQVQEITELSHVPFDVFPLKVAYVQLANPHLVFVSPRFSTFTEDDFSVFGKFSQEAFLTPFQSQFPLSNISMIYSNALGISGSDIVLLNDIEKKLKIWHLSVYERGVGLTLCCGSGAVASRIALESMGLVPSDDLQTSLQLAGGPVKIQSHQVNGEAQRTLTGAAEYVCKGTYSWYKKEIES